MQTKTNIKAEIVADSINQGDRLTSLLVTFPRIILAEVNTRRMLSKNTSSSRAIPFNKMVEAVQNDPFIPIAWQKHHSGMQGSEYITDEKVIQFKKGVWLNARYKAVQSAEELYGNMSKARSVSNVQELPDTGITKQLANRLLEPFMWTTMLITGSKEGWDNFFRLRCPQYLLYSEQMPIYFKSKKDLLKYVHKIETDEFKEQYDNLTNLDWLLINEGQAEIHIMDLAEKIYDAVNESTPKQLNPGEWHIPFGDKIQEDDVLPVLYQIKAAPSALVNYRVKISTAMAARTSYTVVGDEKGIDYAKMIELHDRLITQDPPHSSPMEHCARAMSDEEYYSSIKTTSYPLHIPRNKEDVEVNGGFVNKELYPQHKQYGKNVDKTMYGWCRNFRGFIQYRHLIEMENGNKK